MLSIVFLSSKCVTSEVVQSLIKRKDLPEWEANIEGTNAKGNTLSISSEKQAKFCLLSLPGPKPDTQEIARKIT